MLTADMMIEHWNILAEKLGIDPGADQDEHGLKALTMEGTIDGRVVSLAYRRVEHQPQSITDSLSDESFPRYGAADATHLTGYVLVASTASNVKGPGTVRVTRDPVPTFRMVASWFGKGDPTVGDKPFDERYLIDTDNETLARDVLTPPLRAAIQAAAGMGAEFAYTDGRAQLSLSHVTDGTLGLQAALDVMRTA